MSIQETLSNAKNLIEDRDSWCKGSAARNDLGCCVSPNDERACRWCTIGAIYKVIGASIVTDEFNNAIEFIQNHLRDSGERLSVGLFNDEHTHEEVIGMLETVINKAREMDV